MNLRSLFARSKNARAIAGGCVALAAGSIVLLRAPHVTRAATAPNAQRTLVDARPTADAVHGAPRVRFAGPGMHGSVAFTQGAVEAGAMREVYAEVRVAADPSEGQREAPPVALAVVLDVSGSMAGEKLEQARAAVGSLVERMRDGDRIAFVTYSDSARMVQPLARVSEVRAQLRLVLPTVQIQGGTNIPSGLALGEAALNEAPAGMVRRVVLLSDGQDGSGQSLESVRQTVRARADAGVSLSSLGIGTDYDERFMAGVADAGRGNYEFLRDGAQVGPFLARELQQTANTTLDRAVVELDLPAGWTLTGHYGTEPTGTAGRVSLPIGPLAAGDERRMVLRLAVPATAPSANIGTLAATVQYRHVPSDRAQAVATGGLMLRVVATEGEALATRDPSLYGDALAVVLASRQQEAVVAWRSGNAVQAQQIANDNLALIRAAQAAAPTVARAAQIRAFESDATNFAHTSASSSEGRAYGLRVNAVHRRALSSESAYE